MAKPMPRLPPVTTAISPRNREPLAGRVLDFIVLWDCGFFAAID